MLPRICIACGEPIKDRIAINPNVCETCCCDVQRDLLTDTQPRAEAPARSRVSNEPRPAHRRSPAIGDHSHERKTSPTLPRRKHQSNKA